MSAELEDICLSQGLPVYRPVENSEAIEVIASGKYPMNSHWFRIFKREDRQVGVILEFPACKIAEIKQVDEFCKLVTERVFGSCARLHFNTADKLFFLGGLAQEETLAEFLKTLAHGCDVVKPLCESVGRQGWWDKTSINLALIDTRDMFRG